MIADELRDLKNSGKLKQFISVGIIPVRVSTQLDIYDNYLNELDKNRKLNDCIMISITNTANNLKCSDRTVYRAIKFCQQEINENRSNNTRQE